MIGQRMKWQLALAVVVAAVMLSLAGCGSSSSSSSSSSSASSSGSSSSTAAAASAHGSVSVLYAASLQDLMNTSVGPALQRATGYGFNGYPAGSSDLANEIKGKVRRGDVFISASPKVNSTLEGSANGSWVSWYAPFASTSLVIGYNPKSPFAAQLKTKPWYQVVTKPGFKLGFTDPKLDPKGVLAVAALNQAAATYHDPALKKIATNTSDVFPEQDLVGRLQAGQLDAGFFYTVEASAAKIPTVSLGSIHKSGEYTITTLHGAPDETAAVAFVKFLLSSRGQTLLRGVGLTVSPQPTSVGSGVPASLGGVIHAGS